MSKKQFGLIKPKEAKKAAADTFFQKKNIFDDDSDDESPGSGAPGTSTSLNKKGTDWVRASMQAKMKKQTKLELNRAVEQDETVFQYDEVYDEMKEKKKKEESISKKEADKKPKYIVNLLKQADVRNRENERRMERKVHLDREAEGEEFKDKEVFVTSAYRKKMEEMQKEEEEEQRKERMEAVLDVTKQKDMSGFYRHIYRQTMGEEKGQKDVKEDEVVKEEKEEAEVKKEAPSDDDNEAKQAQKSTSIKKVEKTAKERSYRKRTDPHAEEDGENSSGSGSSSSSDDGEDDDKETDAAAKMEVKSREEKEAERRRKMKEEKEKRERRKRRIERGEDSSSDEEEKENEGKDEKAKSIGSKDDGSEKTSEAAAGEPKAKKVKKDVWKKETVGSVLQDALERYFQRKSEREGFPWSA
jgi:coiled-coil domain-containing protein 55